MSMQTMNASCRVALAAMLHDLGKFAERARIPINQTDDEAHRDQYCPRTREGRWTHVHAAYTGFAFDQVVPRELREIEDLWPFAGWGGKGADDSLVNAAARHHRPETLLQWVIATADRLASGFEREAFESYNQSPDDGAKKLDHYTTRQWTLLESINLTSRTNGKGGADEGAPNWRYPLKALAPDTIFPVPANACEGVSKSEAQDEYRQQWDQFLVELNDIPASHREQLPLWLDHFDTLWLTFTHAIPSATAGNVRPDVSLYDHSKTTAALAVALWRYHVENRDDTESVSAQLRAQWDRECEGSALSRQAWEADKFLLVQGDFTGIQDFIFAGGESQKHVARLLRGRSFHVSLLSELAALKVLEVLELPTVSQIVNAAGKFLIVAPNTAETASKLHAVQSDLNDWFLTHTYGQSGINLTWLPARAADFRHGKNESPFRELMKRLFEALEAAKLRRLGLCGKAPPAAIFDRYLARFAQGECKIDGRSPAQVQLEGDWVSELAWDQVMTGKWLAHQDRLFITRHRIEPLVDGQLLNQLRLPIFGFHVLFTGKEEASGKFGGEAKSGNLMRAWDFSLPESGNQPLWNGYARRAINAIIPIFGEVSAWESDRYHGLSSVEDDLEPRFGTPKTLNHLARDDRQLDENGKWTGAEALMTLKGDVDNLGLIFQNGFGRPTFARMAGLSRQVNAFFTVYLPWLCRKQYPNTYTVFAGGDDFFLIGPWRSTMRLVLHMRDEFRRYVAGNPDIHFSGGLSMTKPGLPIRHLAKLAERALDDAKRQPGKNAVTCFGQSVGWDDFVDLMEREKELGRLAAELSLSTGYLYGLIHLTDMAADTRRPENAIWHSRFAYRTRRMLEAKVRNDGDRENVERRRRALQQELAREIASTGIEKHGAAYKIALFTHLYQQRD